MNKRGVLPLAMVLASAALGGCGYLMGDEGVFRDRSNDYREARYEDGRLAVPEGMSEDALGDAYVIPEVAETVLSGEKFEVPYPAPLTSGDAEQLVRIQRLGEERWALFELTPAQLWPQVRSFLSASGLNMVRQDAQAGIMESQWVQLEGAKQRSRFRFRIEQGVQRGSSELHILQMNQSDKAWPASSDNPEQESTILKAVAQYVANRTESASVSLLAERGINAEGKVVLKESSGGDYYLELALPYHRAWASLAPALKKSTFEITDRNRSDGRYFVTFSGPESEEDRGWFSGLFGGDDDPLLEQAFVVLLDKQSDDLMRITIQKDDGEALDRRDAQRLLSLIKGNIN